MADVAYLGPVGPPSSPPILLLRRANKIAIAISASARNRDSENAKLKNIPCKKQTNITLYRRTTMDEYYIFLK